MDKELPESALGPKPGKSFIRLSPSNLPGVKEYTACITRRRTIGIEEIASRIVGKRSELRKETFISAFNLIKEEIYNAIEEGFNVDFGFGRTEITVNGPFGYLGEKFDRKKHTLAPSLRPSPQLKQRTARIPVENITQNVRPNAPQPAYVSLEMKPRTHESTEPYNQLPAGRHPFVSIYGDRLKLMGDLPGVGIRLYCAESGEEHFITPKEVIINTSRRLCFIPPFDFTPGEWEAVVGSQFTPTYKPYKQERYGYLTFTVV